MPGGVNLVAQLTRESVHQAALEAAVRHHKFALLALCLALHIGHSEGDGFQGLASETLPKIGAPGRGHIKTAVARAQRRYSDAPRLDLVDPQPVRPQAGPTRAAQGQQHRVTAGHRRPLRGQKTQLQGCFVFPVCPADPAVSQVKFHGLPLLGLAQTLQPGA